MTHPEQTNALLERTVEETKRTGETVLASAVVALTGGLHVLGALQLWRYLVFTRRYAWLPYAVIGVGIAFVVLGSKLYAQRLWAAKAATGGAAVAALLVGALFVWAALHGIFSALFMVMPAASVAATVCAALAIRPVRCTSEARRRAKAAGLDIDF